MEHSIATEVHAAVFTPATDSATPMRLDVFWTARLADRDVSRARIREAIEAGLAMVNGQPCRKPGYKPRPGETLTLSLPETAGAAIAAEDRPLTILFRDEDLLVLDKPAGLTVHPAPGLPGGTLVNRLVHHFPELADLAGPRPGIVHRLDKDTSGLIVVALTEPARLALAATFAARATRKTYLALVHGRPPRDEETLREPIGRDPDHPTRMAVVKKGGREAVSRYRLVWSAPQDRASLLEVAIATGRTHQIRVHLAHLGHPLVGDSVYGPRQAAEWKRLPGAASRLAGRQMLHAWKLCFPHPTTGQAMAFTCPLPRDFWRLLLLLGRRCQRVGLVGQPGCGKSALLARLAAAGFATISADAEVAALYAPGGDGAHVLARRFGPAVLDAAGGVDKAWLLCAMRENEKSRREVMELVHPLVKGRMTAFFAGQAHKRAAFAEIPLLLETGWRGGREVDLVAGLRCERAVRRERLSARGWDEAVMAAMDGWQWDEAKKLGLCRYVIDNSGDLDALDRETAAFLAALAHERREDACNRYDALAARGYVPNRRGGGGDGA